VLNLVSHNGFSSCLKCLQPGESQSIKDGKIHILYLKTLKFKFYQKNSDRWSQAYFQYQTDNPTGPKRTDENWQTSSTIAIRNNKPVDGVKGTCALFNLQHYKPVSGTCIDYMHSVLEGVVKNFFKYWFDAQYAGENFTLRKHVAVINDRLFRIKPPSFVPYTPRSIDTTDLRTAQKIIQDFVFELPNIYSSSMLLSGVHELLHLVECTEQFGHLNSVNCFVFEELNRKATSFIHGKDLIGEEFIKIFTTAQAFAVSAENVNVQTNIGQFIQEFSQFKTSKRKKQFLNRKIRINKIEVSTNPNLLELYRKFNNRNDLEFKHNVKSYI
jgi:hypothetical protein